MSIHRYAAKRDANELEIVAALRSIGVSVIFVSGKGAPDLICYHPREGTRLIEVKTKHGKFTKAQRENVIPYCVCRDVSSALALFGVKA